MEEVIKINESKNLIDFMIEELQNLKEYNTNNSDYFNFEIENNGSIKKVYFDYEGIISYDFEHSFAEFYNILTKRNFTLKPFSNIFSQIDKITSEYSIFVNEDNVGFTIPNWHGKMIIEIRYNILENKFNICNCTYTGRNGWEFIHADQKIFYDENEIIEICGHFLKEDINWLKSNL